MSLINVTYIISDIDKSLAFEWISSHINTKKINLQFILLNPRGSALEEYLRENNVSHKRISYSGKKDLLKSIYLIFKILRRTNCQVVHCHLFNATLVGLVAASLAFVKKRIFTRHHSTYNHLYNPKGILIDKLCNLLATDIIAISQNVKDVLLNKEHVPNYKLHLIHHGFDFNSFNNVSLDEINKLENKYNPKRKRPVIGVIARWIEWKGIQYIIPAFMKVLEKFPNAYLILANANGPFEGKINELLINIPDGSYKIVPFENDIFALYKLFDIYVHVPIDSQIEAFGQTYVEALVAGAPSVFTLSGVAREFIQKDKNAIVVDFQNSDQIFDGIVRLLSDSSLSQKLIEQGKIDISIFTLSTMIEKLTKVYTS